MKIVILIVYASAKEAASYYTVAEADADLADCVIDWESTNQEFERQEGARKAAEAHWEKRRNQTQPASL